MKSDLGEVWDRQSHQDPISDGEIDQKFLKSRLKSSTQIASVPLQLSLSRDSVALLSITQAPNRHVEPENFNPAGPGFSISGWVLPL